MQRLYLARDRVEAQFLRDFLDAERIGAVILGDYLAGAAGELPANIFPAVWVVEDSDLERARVVLARFLDQGRAAMERAAWTCPHCGESVDGGFDCCWSCGTSRPEPEPESGPEPDQARG
jgi:hypothetical protein